MLRRGTRWPACRDLGIVENEHRNKIITDEGVRASRHGLSVMTLVQQKKHGHILLESFQERGLNAAFIFGEHDQDQRRKALRGLANRELDVLIGSTILDVGVDVPAIGMTILAGGGKAEVGTRQRIGRGLRKKKQGPNVGFFCDFEDSCNKYLHEHALTRRAIVEGTPGFAENILISGQDLPYHHFVST